MTEDEIIKLILIVCVIAFGIGVFIGYQIGWSIGALKTSKQYHKALAERDKL